MVEREIGHRPPHIKKADDRMAEKKMIPLADAAKRLGISWERAWRLVLNGKLEGRRSGRSWMVSTKSIRKLAAPSKDNQ